MLVDAHHHLWRYNDRDYGWMNNDALAPLRRDYLADDLVQAAAASNVSGAIAVQACQTVGETRWLLDVAARHPLVQAVVGWVPLYSPDVAADLEQLGRDSKLKGVRHIVQDEPDDQFILRDDFNRGVAQLKQLGLVYDILIYERHLSQAIEFVDRHPQQVFVLDHVAKPKIKENILQPWADRIHELAKRENVHCKISGMATEADWRGWTVEQLRVYVDIVLSAFGPQRLMFGSDWPVLTLAGSYSDWVGAFRSFIGELSADEQERISSSTAREVYRL